MAQRYEDEWQLPNCVGAMDGKHVRIMRPSNSGSLYYNYKHFYSIILLGIVDADYNFLYIQVGAEGRNSDGGVYMTSHIKRYLDDVSNPLQMPQPRRIPGCAGRVPYYFVADDAFRLHFTTMKPYGGHGLTRNEQVFNKRLSRGRRTVENVFGIMAQKFKCLLHCIEHEPFNVEVMVTAMCVLHNFLRNRAPQVYMPQGTLDEQLDDNDYNPGSWRNNATLTELKRMSGRNATQYATDMRTRLTNYFVTPQGQYHWQY